MRMSQQQYLELIARKELKNLPTVELEKKESDRQERRKFREHINSGHYEFCDSYFMEGQGNERSV